MEKFDGYTLMYIFKNLAGISIEDLAAYLLVSVSTVNRYLNVFNNYKFPKKLRLKDVHYAANEIRKKYFSHDLDGMIKKFFYLLENDLGMGRATAELKKLYDTKEREIGNEKAFSILLDDFFIKCKTGYEYYPPDVPPVSNAGRIFKKEAIGFTIIASEIESEREINDLVHFLNDFIRSWKQSENSIDLEISINDLGKCESPTKKIFCILVNTAFEREMQTLFDNICQLDKNDNSVEVISFVCDTNKNRRIHKSVDTFEDAYYEYFGRLPLHYYEFSTVKLAALKAVLSFAKLKKATNATETINYDETNNKIIVNGQDLGNLENFVGEYAVKNIKAFQDEINILNEKFEMAYAKYNQEHSEASRTEMYRRLDELQNKRNELSNIKRAAFKNMMLVFDKELFQEELDTREKMAISCINEADYDKANEILRDPEWKAEALALTSIFDEGKKSCSKYISGQKLLISNISITGINDERKREIINIYEELMFFAEKYQVSLEIIYEYAEFLYNQNDFQKGIIIAKRMESYKLLDSSLPVDSGSLFFLIGRLYYGAADYKEAGYYYEKALNVYEENPVLNEKKIQYMYSEMATLYWRTGKYIESKRKLKEIVGKLEKEASQNERTYLRILADVYNRFAILAEKMRVLDEAIEYHLKAIYLRENIYNNEPNNMEAVIELAKSYSNIGIVYRRLKEFDKSKKFFEKALELKEGGYNKSKSYFAFSLAITYSCYAKLLGELKNTEEAEKYVKKAIEIKKDLIKEGRNILSSLAISYDDYGLILYHAGNRREDAEKMFLFAIDIKEKLIKEDYWTYIKILAYSYCHYADLLALDEPVNAEEYYLKSIEIWHRLEKESPGYFTSNLCESYHHSALIAKDKTTANSRFYKAEKYGELVFNRYSGYAGYYKKLLEDFLAFTNNNYYGDTLVKNRLEEKIREIDKLIRAC